MKAYSVRLQYTHRKFGPGMGRTIDTHGSNFRVAVGKAMRSFFGTLTRKDMNDIRSGGLRIEVRETGEVSPAEAAPHAQ